MEQITDQYIRQNADQFTELQWNQLCENPSLMKLSPQTFADFEEFFSWRIISEYQTLSENFIRLHQNKVNWKVISKCQTLSESFAIEFEDKISWFYFFMMNRKNLSDKFLLKYSHKSKGCNLGELI